MSLPPKRNAAYTFYLGLVSQADTKLLQTNPTIAAGDFQVSTGGGAFANLATLPVVEPAGSQVVKVVLSAAEMNAANVVVRARDAAGAEWCDALFPIQTSLRQIDDLATAVLKRGVAFPNFPFSMVLTATSLAATGKTVSVYASLDGGAEALIGTATEVGNGGYEIDLSSANMNAASIALRMTAADCWDRRITLLTEP